jgi:hypothetical protein
MQVDRYNHLQFPRDAQAGSNNPAAMGKDAQPAAGGAAGMLAKPQGGVPVPAVAPAASRPDGVVLKIQWPGGAQGAAQAADAALYAPGRRVAASDDADTGAMARGHQLAVDRNAGIVTQISVDKDGVLIARPHPVAPDKQPDFVALAVSAMREYRDDPERQRSSTAAQASAPEAHWSALKGLQQFAAKLNVFA